jgi:regulator of replication initiation timing
MSDNVTELLAEITRQRAELKDAIGLIERLREEIRHLRATLDDRMIRQDAEIATMRGSMAPHPADDEPGNYTHDVAPSAPR